MASITSRAPDRYSWAVGRRRQEGVLQRRPSAATARGARRRARAASSPTRSIGQPVDLDAVGCHRLVRRAPPACSRVARTAPGPGVRTRTHRVGVAVDELLRPGPARSAGPGRSRRGRRPSARSPTSRWLLTSTVLPCRARWTSTSRIQRMPSGSRPLAGSSRMTVCGSPSSTPASPRRWRMPSE